MVSSAPCSRTAAKRSSLLAAAMTVASDGTWIGLLHLPSACGRSGAPAVLAVELASLGSAQPRVEPDAPGTQDAAADPIFIGRGDDERLVWLSDAGTVLRWSPSDGTALPAVSTPLDANPSVVGRSGTGVAVAAGRDLAFVGFTAGDAAPVWTLDGVGTIRALVAADALPGVAAVALGENGLAIVAGLDQEPDPERVERLLDATLSEALVGPYGYLYVTSDIGLIAYDALTATTGGTLLRVPGSGQALGSLEPRGLAWIFAAPPAAP